MDASIAALISEAGFTADQPVSFSAQGRGGALSGANGRWSPDRPVEVGDLFYAASLTKQVTGAVAAVLAAAGQLDLDAPIASLFLPTWTERPTPRHLLHHVGGLAEDVAGLGADATIRAAMTADGFSPPNWSNARALEMAVRLPVPALPPGSA